MSIRARWSIPPVPQSDLPSMATADHDSGVTSGGEVDGSQARNASSNDCGSSTISRFRSAPYRIGRRVNPQKCQKSTGCGCCLDRGQPLTDGFVTVRAAKHSTNDRRQDGGSRMAFSPILRTPRPRGSGTCVMCSANPPRGKSCSTLLLNNRTRSIENSPPSYQPRQVGLMNGPGISGPLTRRAARRGIYCPGGPRAASSARLPSERDPCATRNAGNQ